MLRYFAGLRKCIILLPRPRTNIGLQLKPRTTIGVDMKNVIIILLFAAFIGMIPASTFYIAGNDSHNTLNTVNDIQLLLSLKGLYVGPLNGSCNAETLRAIEAYERTLIRSTLPIECSAPLLDRLKSDLHNTLAQNASAPSKSSAGTSSNTTNSEIADVKAQLYNVNNTIKSVQDGFSSYFTTQFQSLTQMGVSAFATAISILIAFAALIGNNLIKDTVKAAHEEAIANSKKELDSMISVAQPQISAAVHTDLSDSFTLLYANLDPNEHRHLYNPYVTAAVDMADRGYRHARGMYDLIKHKHAGENAQGDKPKLSEMQSFIMDAALNNYAYFLSTKTALKKVMPKKESESSKRNCNSEPKESQQTELVD
jgi:hypothetical protein